MAGNPEQARILNRCLILTQLKGGKALSRVELSKILDLSKMTVSVIVSDLISEGLVAEVGEGEAARSGGRKPILLALSKNKYVIGFDIGEATTSVALSDLQGNVIDGCSLSTSKDKTPDCIVRQIVEQYRNLVEANNIDESTVIGIGVSAAGLVDKEKGNILFSPDFNWKNLNLRNLLNLRIGQPVTIDNCTRVMALGETWYGVAQSSVNLLYVNVGYGIGSALMIGGKLYNNNSEFGHIRVTNKDVSCHCGKEGCLEAVASGYAIEKAYHQAKGGRGVWNSAKDIADMARNGDKDATGIFNDAGRYLGRSISMAVNLFNPDKVVIGGGISLAEDLLMTSLLEEYRRNTMDVIRDKTLLEVSTLGQKAGVRGAVALALDSFLE